MAQVNQCEERGKVIISSHGVLSMALQFQSIRDSSFGQNFNLLRVSPVY
jgi:hypothetical protein